MGKKRLKQGLALVARPTELFGASRICLDEAGERELGFGGYVNVFCSSTFCSLSEGMSNEKE